MKAGKIEFKEAVKLIKESTLVRYEDEYKVEMKTEIDFEEEVLKTPDHIDGEFIAMLGEDYSEDEYMEPISVFTPEDKYELYSNGLMRIESEEEGVNWLYLFK